LKLFGRGIDYISLYASVWRYILTLADRDDILIAKTDPPLLSILAMWAAERRGAYLVNWLQDLYPEVAIQLGVPLLKGPVGEALSHMRNTSLKSAAANVVPGHRMAEKLVSCGVALERIHVIPNWCHDEQICPISHGENPLRKQWALEDKFVVGYAGNLGRAHEFNTLLDAAQRLRSERHFLFLFIGSGYHSDELARQVKEACLDGLFRFVPYQSEVLLNQVLCAPDVHWLSLRPELEGLIVPSKFYGIAAAGRPVISVTAKDGEIAQLVQQYECGLVIEPGNADALAESLVLLSQDSKRVTAMGQRARAMLDAHFTRRQAFDHWRGVLEDIESRRWQDVHGQLPQPKGGTNCSDTALNCRIKLR
jgi:glycosyltransferase involved in cell wall biosynthesis